MSRHPFFEQIPPFIEEKTEKTCGLCQKSADYAEMVEKNGINGNITQICF